MSGKSLQRARKALAKIDQEIASEVQEEARKKRKIRKIGSSLLLLLLFTGLVIFLIPSLRKMANILPIAQGFLPEEGVPVITLEEVTPLGKGRLRCVLRYYNSEPGEPIEIRTVEIIDETDGIDYAFPVEKTDDREMISMEFALGKERLPTETTLTFYVTDTRGYPSAPVTIRQVRIF